jgi:hypothetical protein
MLVIEHRFAVAAFFDRGERRVALRDLISQDERLAAVALVDVATGAH